MQVCVINFKEAQIILSTTLLKYKSIHSRKTGYKYQKCLCLTNAAFNNTLLCVIKKKSKMKFNLFISFTLKAARQDNKNFKKALKLIRQTMKQRKTHKEKIKWSYRDCRHVRVVNVCIQ